MKEPGKILKFINRNIVLIVTVPGIVLMHWAWIKLQDTPPAKLHPSQAHRNEAGEVILPITEVLYNNIFKFATVGPICLLILSRLI